MGYTLEITNKTIQTKIDLAMVLKPINKTNSKLTYIIYSHQPSDKHRIVNNFYSIRFKIAKSNNSIPQFAYKLEIHNNTSTHKGIFKLHAHLGSCYHC